MSINKWMNIPSSQQKWERIKNTSNFWHNLINDWAVKHYGDTSLNLAHIY